MFILILLIYIQHIMFTSTFYICVGSNNNFVQTLYKLEIWLLDGFMGLENVTQLDQGNNSYYYLG